MTERKLTDAEEDALFNLTNQRKMVSEKYLCRVHNISRTTLRSAIKRARNRRFTGEPTPCQKQ